MAKHIKTICIISCFLIIIFLLVIHIFSLTPRYPKLTGPSQVGHQLYNLIDHNNQYSLELYQEINCTIFYPAQQNKASINKTVYRPDYIDTIRHKIAELKHTPYLLWLLLIPNVYTYSTLNAPFDTTNNHCPVILYLPGIGGVGLDLYYPMELASYGYIVVAIEPTGDQLITVLPNGKSVNLNQDLQSAIKTNNRTKIYQYRNKAHIQWTKYINMTLDYLSIMNQDSKSFFYQKLDLNRTGIFGSSHGGAVALDYCQNNTRIKAGINMDGWTKTYNKTTYFSTPFLMLIGEHGGIINIPEIKELALHNQRTTFFEIIIKNANHNSFGDEVLNNKIKDLIQHGSIYHSEKIRKKIFQSILDFFNLFV